MPNKTRATPVGKYVYVAWGLPTHTEKEILIHTYICIHTHRETHRSAINEVWNQGARLSEGDEKI